MMLQRSVAVNGLRAVSGKRLQSSGIEMFV